MKLNIDFFYRTSCLMFLIFTLDVANTKGNEATDSLLTFDNIEISLLTCEPHEEIYSLYGHTAIRIKNLQTGEDLAVNYGVFDSRDPLFVPHFVFGLTDYTMEILPMYYFIKEYSYYGSAVKEQVLNLSEKEKSNLLAAIYKNSLPENKKYRYNFFYNNCTSKARDIIVSNIDGDVIYDKKDSDEEGISFRQLIHLKNKDYPWAAFGNDLLLGYEADKETTVAERQFLPEELMYDFLSASIKNPDGSTRKLVKEEHWTLKKGISQLKPIASFPLSPRYLFLFMAVIMICLSIAERKYLKRRIVIFDWISLTILGIAGLVLTAMIFSEHPTVNKNLQILFLNPLWLVYCPLRKKYPIADKIAAVFIIIFLLGAFFQTYAEGMFILACGLLCRIVIVYDSNIKKATKTDRTTK